MSPAPVDAVLERAVRDPGAFRLHRIEQAGRPYWPITLPDGAYVGDVETVRWLSEIVDARPEARGRRAWAILADESMPQPAPDWQTEEERAGTLAGRRWRWDVRRLVIPPSVPVRLQPEAIIGALTRVACLPPGWIVGTVGYALAGELAFEDTVLASVAWRALQDGVLGSVSLHVLSPEPATGPLLAGTADAVTLMAPGFACLLSTRVLR
jgi:hypothetical protein